LQGKRKGRKKALMKIEKVGIVRKERNHRVSLGVNLVKWEYFYFFKFKM
jgi:hypothetical protein